MLTGIIWRPFFTFSGISAKSFSLSFGIKTVFKPPRRAARSFSLRPPIGRTRPLKVISPVNLPSDMAAHASQLYAKNLENFIDLITEEG